MWVLCMIKRYQFITVHINKNRDKLEHVERFLGNDVYLLVLIYRKHSWDFIQIFQWYKIELEKGDFRIDPKLYVLGQVEKAT